MRSRSLMLLLAVSLLATGCFRANTTIRVNDDGSGEIESLMALDIDAALELANAFSTEDVPEMTAEEACADFEQSQDVPEGAVVEPYREDGLCGMRYTLAFGPDEFEEAVLDASSDGQFELRRDGEGWVFSADLSSDDVTGGEEGDDFLPTDIFDDAEMTIGVLLPGRMVEHNATYVDTDGTAVWEIDLSASSTNMFARSEPGEPILGSGPGGDGGSSTVTVIVVLVVLAAAGLGVWWLMRRRREGDRSGGSSLAPPGSGPGSPSGPAPGSPLGPAPGSPAADPGSSLPPPTGGHGS